MNTESKIGNKCIVGDGAHASIPRLDFGVLYLTSKNFKTEGIDLTDLSFISISDYEKHFRDKSKALTKPKNNDLILSIIGSIGAPYLVKATDKFGISSSVAIIRPLDELDSEYLFYYLKSSGVQNYVEAIKSGSAQGFLSLEMIKSIPLNYPTKPEQQRIASILSAYDDLIENNNKRIALLEQMAEQIYKEWFVRMRFPGYENAAFEKGVPKGWLVELSDYITVVKGKSYTGEEINEVGEGIPFVNLKSFNRGGGYRYDGIKFYTGKYHQKQVVKEGDIVMAVTDMTQDRAVVGRVSRIPKTEFSEMVISLDAAKIVLKKNIPPSFFYATLRFGFFGNTIKEFANGSNVLHLKPELAYKMKSIIPTDESLMLRMDNIIEPYFNQIDNCFLQNQILKQTRDLLLPRLISGKFRVKENETLSIKEKV